MTRNEELKILMKQYNLNIKDIARLLNVTPSCVYGWLYESDKAHYRKMHKTHLTHLNLILEGLPQKKGQI